MDVLVEGIRKFLGLTQTLRQAGAVVQLPPQLVQVCREVLHEVESSPASSPRPPSSVNSQMSVADKALQELPLRRLLLQVIAPGETFTVTEVVNRLAKLGVTADSAKVSNALGYQVDRGQLVREHRGLYTYPVETLSANATGTTVPGYAPSPDAVGGSTHDDRRQSGNDHGRRTVAVRGQEDRRGKSTAQERKKAV
ncbi:hypothetical protein [Amycolatopsis sp. cmx-11-32]|uniref:hypothetical protein n=1 Tax=Amycolatopsis sp. cmx-11-32 TaxID=2785796 RepID=UPI0039E3D139